MHSALYLPNAIAQLLPPYLNPDTYVTYVAFSENCVLCFLWAPLCQVDEVPRADEARPPPEATNPRGDLKQPRNKPNQLDGLKHVETNQLDFLQWKMVHRN